MKIVFMGTPRFAAISLEHLLKAEKEISLVVSQPDRKKGRGRKIKPTPVKETALKYRIQVEQPPTPNSPEFIRTLKSIEPELIVVVSYGHILKPDILVLPSKGCINLHPSLLPKYRGAAPIQWAIIRGETETGITTFFMNEKMDAGDMIEQVRLSINEEETFGELEERLARLGADVLLSTVNLIESGKEKKIPQNDSEATFAPKIDPKICKVDWSEDSKHISQLIRGLSPQPGAYCFFRGKRIKLLRASWVAGDSPGEAGEIIVSEARLLVKAKNGSVWIKELQPEGKRPMKDSDFINGYRPKTHERME